MRVKICGLTNEEDVLVCSGAGADALGFVVDYPVPVPWNLTATRAKELLAKVPPLVTTVLVTAGPLQKIEALVHHLRPALVQLHGDEGLEETRRICTRLAEVGVGVIKALRLEAGRGRAHFDISDPLEAARSLAETGITALLLDVAGPGGAGGTGQQLDWQLAAGIGQILPKPLIIAGGLNCNNVGQAIKEARPYAVDVITGVESNRGKKDPVRVRAFIKQAKGVT